MTTLYTKFLPEVAPHCGGAPEPQVTNAIRNACIEFCDRSWVWLFDLPPFQLVLKQQDYVVTGSLPAQSVISRGMYGYFNGKPIDAITREQVIQDFPNWRLETGTRPLRFLGKDGGTIISLIPIPVANSVVNNVPLVPDGVTLTVALKPTRASTGLPDWIYENHLEDIAHGALFRMYSMPKKEWTNANLAGTHKTMFLDGCSSARLVASKSFTRASNRNRNTGVARW